MTVHNNPEHESSAVAATSGLLEGVRIIAFTQFLLGPAAAQYLADMGADVIKIEEPTEGPHERRWAGANSFVGDLSTFFMLAHRNVRSVGIDLKQPEGQDLARRLCRDADVVLVNFRPGVMEKLGLGYDILSADNARLVYACASGYGADSPHRNLPGQDLLLQATSGLASVTGDRNGHPVAAGAAVVDQHAAALLAMGVLGALHRATVSGQGQQIEVTMLEAAFDLQAEPLLYHLNGALVERPRVPLASSFHEAPYGFYEVQDGYVALSLSPMELISKVLGSPEVLQHYLDPTVALSHREDIYEALSPLIAKFEKAELLQLFREHGIWCAPVNTYDDLASDEAVAHLDSFQTIEHPAAGQVRLLKHPIRYSSTPATLRRVPPALGQHTMEVLEGVGYVKEEIQELHDRGVV